MLEIVTFTGVDEHTDLGEVQALMDEYPFAEFAILIGSQTAGGENPIFPPMRVFDEFRLKLPEDRIALHLCGGYARPAASNPRPAWSYTPAWGMNRVQVNIHPEGPFDGINVDPDDPDPIADALIHFAEYAVVGSLILQHRGAWSRVPTDHTRIEYLFDRSEGAGIEDFGVWPCPPQHTGRRYGFAGGIGPHNIDLALNFVGEFPNARMWLDMERRVRDENYRFDLKKVRAVCKAVEEWKEIVVCPNQ